MVRVSEGLRRYEITVGMSEGLRGYGRAIRADGQMGRPRNRGTVV